MSWKQKLLLRVLPLWAAAAVLSFAPHLCWGFRSGGSGAAGIAVAYVVLLLPLVGGAYHLATLRRWWGAVAGGAVVSVIGAGFVLSAFLTAGRHLYFHYEESIVFPAVAAVVYLVVAVGATFDRTWNWSRALRALRPGGGALAFVCWAGLVSLVWYSAWRNLVTVWYFPEPPYEAVAWTVLHVLVFGALFQFALRAERGLTLRGGLCYVSVCYTLGAMDAFLGTRTFGFGVATIATTGLTLAILLVFLTQAELGRRLPDVAWRARQRAFVNRRTVVASALAAVFLLVIALWSVLREDSAWWAPVLYLPATALVFVVMLHLALVARLRALLVVKLGFSCLTLAAATDLVFSASRIGAGLFETLTVGMGGVVPDQLRVGMISFGVVGWAAACTIAHFEYRHQPLDEGEGEAPPA